MLQHMQPVDRVSKPRSHVSALSLSLPEQREERDWSTVIEFEYLLLGHVHAVGPQQRLVDTHFAKFLRGESLSHCALSDSSLLLYHGKENTHTHEHTHTHTYTHTHTGREREREIHLAQRERERERDERKGREKERERW